MMLSWATDHSMLPREALSIAGEKYAEKFETGESLKSYEKGSLLRRLIWSPRPLAAVRSSNTSSGSMGLGTYGSRSIRSLNRVLSSPHAKILVHIDGDDDPTGASTINRRPDKWDSKGSYPEVPIALLTCLLTSRTYVWYGRRETSNQYSFYTTFYSQLMLGEGLWLRLQETTAVSE